MLAPSPQSKTAETPAPIIWRRLLSPSRRRVRLVSATLLLVTVIGAACAYISRMPIVLKVAELESNVPVRVFGLGTVEARIVSKIGFEVVELNADHGDVVKQGQVLARLHATQQETRAARAKAAVLSAEVAVKKAEANVIKSRAIVTQPLETNRRKQQLVSRQVTSAQLGEEAQRDEDVAKAEMLMKGISSAERSDST